MSIWLNRSPDEQRQSPSYAYIYVGLSIGTIVSDVVRTVFFFSVILHGSNDLHQRMLKGLLYTSVQFFESNPSGRILGRVSKDQKVIDDVLHRELLSTLKTTLTLIGSLVIVCAVKPYIVIVIVLLIPCLIVLCRCHTRSQKQLKRLESVTRSPVYELLTSSLNGLATIRAFRVQDQFLTSFTDRIDRNTRAFINMHGALRCFGLRLSLVPFINTFATAMILIAFRDEIDASLMALCLMYTVSIPKSIQLTVQRWFEVDSLMTSAERIDQYSYLPSEEDHGGDQRLVQTPPDWPTEGKIHFQGYSLAHGASLGAVLRNMDVQINSREKIGIIGRTGAGKSSLFKGIFRFVPRSNIAGRILIDDIDISRITLQQLRTQLNIIPQQAVLFSETLRYNLDPFELYSDEQCWQALADVQLKQFVSEQPLGLRMAISESGGNLSAGQCQLLCIARVILKRSRILLIDEATSNVDQNTDNVVQSVIAGQFRDRTVLTIAHRLNTVANSDRILVLDQGVVKDFDTPTNIFQQYH